MIGVETYLGKKLDLDDYIQLKKDKVREYTLRENYDVFLSYYSAGGERFAQHLWKKLPEIGYRAFFAKEDIDPAIATESDEWQKIIDEAILRSKKFSLIMTIGFNTRKEILRELSVARKNDIIRYYFKHSRLDDSKLKINLEGEIIDLAKIEYIVFENDNDLFNNMGEILEGKKEIQVNETYSIKRDILNNFLKPIYNDIVFITRDVSFDYRYDPSTYDKLNKENQYLLQKYDNKKLLKKIEQFYDIMVNRNVNLFYYEERGRNIINRNTIKFLQGKNLSPISQYNIELLKVQANITYKNMKIETRELYLPVDLLYKELGHSIKRLLTVLSCKIIRYFIHTSDISTLELESNEFSTLWEEIVKDTNTDEIFEYLRESVKEIKRLGEDIKNEIMSI